MGIDTSTATPKIKLRPPAVGGPHSYTPSKLCVKFPTPFNLPPTPSKACKLQADLYYYY